MAKSNKKNKTRKKKTENLRPGSNAIISKLKVQKDNPFETIWSRRKFDILGKKRKGEERKIGLARSRAIEKRKKTILKEYEQSAKSSSFVDRRIGEQNNALGEFDKAIMRSQRERLLKLSRRSKYDLSDNEDAGDSGNALFLEKDDFDEVQLGKCEEDDEEGADHNLDANILKELDAPDAQGPLENEDTEGKHKSKSKREVMEEIIMKSKMFKAQKAKEKEEDIQLVEQLDKSYSTLLNSSSAFSFFTPFKDHVRVQDDDSYSKIMGELALEARARPSDRTKTPEEIAQEERERLEHLEEERKRRMNPVRDSSDEDDDEAVKNNHNGVVSGDALDDHPQRTKPNKMGWVDQILERENEEPENHSSDTTEESEEEEDGDNTPAMKDWEQSEEEEEETVVKVKKAYRDGDSEADQLPFVLDVPHSLDELSALFENRRNDEVLEAITRIRKSNAISLKPENRRKMQVFYGVLLQYFAVSSSKRPMNVGVLNLLVKPLIEMSFETPYFAAICARARLSRTRSKFCEDAGKHGWPSLKTLMLLRLWSLIFPCSDFRHAVITPALLLMCEYLMRCRITTGRDAAIGTFLCSIVLSVTKQQAKFCPEPIVFIATLLSSSSSFQWTGDGVDRLDLFEVMALPEDSPFFESDGFRVAVLSASVEALRGFADAYKAYDSFPEIFAPVVRELDGAGVSAGLPAAVRGRLSDAARTIRETSQQLEASRRPLRVRDRKPVPIRMVNPVFEENFVKGRDYDPDRERAERRKMQRLMKRESRGAVRELRKDNYFLQGAKMRDAALLEQERAEKYGRALSFLEEQERAFKCGQLGKGRRKRKS